MGKVIRLPGQEELPLPDAPPSKPLPVEREPDFGEGIRLTEKQRLVMREMRLYAPCTDRKLVTVMKAKYGGTESTWRTRRAELTRMGLIIKLTRVEDHSVWGLAIVMSKV